MVASAVVASAVVASARIVARLNAIGGGAGRVGSNWSPSRRATASPCASQSVTSKRPLPVGRARADVVRTPGLSQLTASTREGTAEVSPPSAKLASCIAASTSPAQSAGAALAIASAGASAGASPLASSARTRPPAVRTRRSLAKWAP